MGRKKRRVSLTRRLHRTLGAAAAVFILFMALSGLLINHAQQFELDRTHVSQPFLLTWYGIDGPSQIRSYQAGNRWLSFADSRVYFDGKFISTLAHGVGAVSSNNLLVAAGNEELLLIDGEGELIERIRWDRPDSGVIESIGLLEDGTVLVRSGARIWAADAQLLQWQPLYQNAPGAEWSIPAEEPGNIRRALLEHYRGDELSMERMLLDLHSGRIFGPVGVLAYDLLALLIAFLAISGTILWFRGKSNGYKKNGKQGAVRHPKKTPP